MQTFSVTLVELVLGDVLEVSAGELFVDEFKVTLFSGEEFAEFRERLGGKRDPVGNGTPLLHLTKEQLFCEVGGIPEGGWFLA